MQIVSIGNGSCGVGKYDTGAERSAGIRKGGAGIGKGGAGF